MNPYLVTAAAVTLLLLAMQNLDVSVFGSIELPAALQGR